MRDGSSKGVFIRWNGTVEWNGMEWNGMTTPTERAMTTYTHYVETLHPRCQASGVSSIKEDELNLIQQGD